MEKIVATLFSIILLTVPIGFAMIIEPGDNGAQFATEVALEKCAEKEVVAVFICNGNVVKVTSLVSGSEVVFYKPNGRIIPCVGEPKDMGAECVQMLHPNFCPGKSVCIPPQDMPEAVTNISDAQNNSQNSGIGIPDIEPNMSVPERIQPPKEGGAISQEVFIFAIIIIGMIAVAIINYVYFKSKGT